jgi:integrase/recombinase XerC
MIVVEGRVCEECGKPIPPPKPRGRERRFCDDRCSGRARYRLNRHEPAPRWPGYEMSNRIAEHLVWCQRRELRPTYIATTKLTLCRVERALGHPLETATDAELAAWWNALDIGTGRLAYVAHLANFYKWLIWERLRDDNPTARLVRPKERRRLPRPIPNDRLHKALIEAENPIREWLLLAAFAGMRACEVATLHRDDILGDVLIVREGKNAKQRILPLHPDVRAALDANAETGWLYPNRSGRPITANTVSVKANRYLHRVGVTETFHQLRHWFGTSTYRASKDLRLTQELMGHASPNTTALYAAWSPERAAAVVNSLRYEP